MLQKFKDKYEIKRDIDLLLILIGFAITGSLSVRVGAPVLDLLGISQETMNPWLFWPLRILIVFPIYQLLLVAVGALLGQFKFFWAFEKKMLSRMGIKL